ncbi:MAG: hypothetical protein UHU21_08050 [Lachnospiraceae bacterium]|nr:hypothetical protein [Lachnospiraceae bacterium]
MLRYLLESGNYTIKAGDVVESSAQDLKVRNQRVWVGGSVTVTNGAVVSVNGSPEPAGTKHTIKTINAIYAYPGCNGGHNAGHAGGKCYVCEVD